MIVYMDLEGTVIDEWSSMTLINIKKLAHFLHINNVEVISIFSFAINDAADVQRFEAELRETLVEVLGVEINITDTSKASDEICERELMDFEDVCYFMNKFRTFTEFAIHNCQDQTVVLLDDEVQNTDMKFKDNNTRVVTIDVTSDHWEDTLIN